MHYYEGFPKAECRRGTCVSSWALAIGLWQGFTGGGSPLALWDTNLCCSQYNSGAPVSLKMLHLTEFLSLNPQLAQYEPPQEEKRDE